MQLLASVERALVELIDNGRVSDKLISHQGENGLFAAIADLVGAARFNGTLLQRYYGAASALVSASILSMNKHVIEMKVVQLSFDSLFYSKVYLLGVLPSDEREGAQILGGSCSAWGV